MILGITLDVGFGPTVGELERGGANMTAGHAAFAEVLAASGGRVGASSRGTDVGREELPHDEADGTDDREESIDTDDEDSRDAFGGTDGSGSVVAIGVELRFEPSSYAPRPWSPDIGETEHSGTLGVEGGRLEPGRMEGRSVQPRILDASRLDPGTVVPLPPAVAQPSLAVTVRESLESVAEAQPSRQSVARMAEVQSSQEPAESVAHMQSLRATADAIPQVQSPRKSAFAHVQPSLAAVAEVQSSPAPAEHKTEPVRPAAVLSSAIDGEGVEADGTDQAEERRASDPPAASRLPSTPVETLTHAGFTAQDRSPMLAQGASSAAASGPSIATAEASAAEVEPLGLADRLVMRERTDAPTEIVAEVNGDDEAVRLRVTTHGRDVSVEAQAMSPRLAELLREHPVALQEALSRHDLVLRGWETGTGPGDDRPPPPRQDRTVPATGNERGSSPSNEHAPTESVLPGSLRVLA